MKDVLQDDLNLLNDEQKKRYIEAKTKILKSNKKRETLILEELKVDEFFSTLNIFKKLMEKESISQVKWNYSTLGVYLSKLVKSNQAVCNKVEGSRSKVYALKNLGVNNEANG
jgi:hypothetical protein